VGCSSRAAASGAAQVDLEAGEAGIPAGRYRLELQGTNPAAAANPAAEGSPCGVTFCWTFHTVQALRDGLRSPQLDLRMSAPGFAVKARATRLE